MGDRNNLLQSCCFRRQAILVIGQRRAALLNSTFINTKGSRSGQNKNPFLSTLTLPVNWRMRRCALTLLAERPFSKALHPQRPPAQDQSSQHSRSTTMAHWTEFEKETEKETKKLIRRISGVEDEDEQNFQLAVKFAWSNFR